MTASTPAPLLEQGIVAHSWDRSYMSAKAPYKVRAWLDIFNLPTFGWRKSELERMVSSFGNLKHHGSLSDIDSMEKLRLAVLAPSLADIPEALLLFLNGISTQAPIHIAGWRDEIHRPDQMYDGEPHPDFFQRLKEKIEEKNKSKNKLKDEQSISVESPCVNSKKHKELIHELLAGPCSSEEKAMLELLMHLLCHGLSLVLIGKVRNEGALFLDSYKSAIGRMGL